MTKSEVIKMIDSIKFDTDIVKEITAESIADFVLNHTKADGNITISADIIKAVALAVQNTAETMKGIIKLAVSDMPDDNKKPGFNYIII